MKKFANLALVFVAASGLAACKKSGGGGGGECDTQIAKAVDSMTAERAKTHPDHKEIDDRAAKVKEIMTKHCNEDKWPAEVTTCIGSATNQRGIRECTDKLPPDVKSKMLDELMTVMVGGGPGHGGMGMPGHPGGLHGADGTGSGAPPAGSDTGSAAPAAPAPAGSAAPAPAAAPAH
ncbi:MAG TPA: hypothetical protein VGM88_22730 [Kofleriaceae bacterium]